MESIIERVYNCFKATAKKPVNKSDFKYRPKREDKDDVKPADGAKTNLLII
jgi:hypothetical protein